VLDLLTLHQLISDDSMVTKITTGWDSSVPPGTERVTVEIKTPDGDLIDAAAN
jgi:hypothetical protein